MAAFGRLDDPVRRPIAPAAGPRRFRRREASHHGSGTGNRHEFRRDRGAAFLKPLGRLPIYGAATGLYENF
jgi:hypothetical protein